MKRSACFRLSLLSGLVLPVMAHAQDVEPAPPGSIPAPPVEGAESTADPAGTFPRLEGELGFVVQDNLIFDSDDPDSEINDIYGEAEGYFRLRLTPLFSLETGLVLEPVLDPEPGQDRAFEDEGLYIEQLLARYATEAIDIFGGKFNPSFGLAWDVTPGIYGADLAEDYELAKRIGFGGALIFGGEGIGGEGFGTHRLTGNLFFVDTTVLSQSVFTERGRTRFEDGGVGNTEDLSSFSLTLDGEELPNLPGIGYHLGVRYQSAGAASFEVESEGSDSIIDAVFDDEAGLFTGFLDPEDETGVVGALTFERPLTERLALSGIGEATYLWDAEGLPQDRLYVTAGAALEIDETWNVALAYTLRDTNTSNDFLVSSTDHLFQVSGGYRWENGLGLDVGYVFTQAEDVDSHGVGAVLSFATDFSIPRGSAE